MQSQLSSEAIDDTVKRAVVLSHYPLTAAFKSECSRIGEEVAFLTLTELRQLSHLGALKRVRSLNADLLVVAAQVSGGTATLPVLRALAGLSRCRRFVQLIQGETPKAFGRLDGVFGLVAIAFASLLSAGAALERAARFAWLRKAGRVHAVAADSKKVVYLNCNLWFGVKAGGSVGHVSGVANGLMAEGHALTFVSAGGHLLVRDQAHFHDLQAPTLFSFPADFNYYRFDRSCVAQLRDVITPDVRFIYQRMSVGNITGVILSRRHRVPLVLEYNGSEVWVAKNWGQPLAFQRLAERAELVALHHAHLVVTVSDVLGDELVQRGVDRSRVVVYPNCIDPVVFDPARFEEHQTASLRSSHGIPANARVVTFLGTFGQWHGAEVLAEAIGILERSQAALLEQHDVHFMLIGDGAKMPEVKRVLERDGGPSKRVHLVGLVPQDSAPGYLAASDVLVSPHVRNPDGSRFFGSPTKLFEYMAMSKAIVASRLDQLDDVLKPSMGLPDLDRAREASADAVALLVEPGVASELAAGIAAVIGNSALRSTLGRNARALALRRYTWQHHVRAILEKVECLK